jgi:hypothetical protein
MLIEIDPLRKEEVTSAMKILYPLDDIILTKMVDVYLGINKAHDEFIIGFNLSIRHLKLVAELVSDGFTLYDSFYTICKGIGGSESMKALEAILGTAKK